MASVDIRRPHQLSLEQAHSRLDQVAARMREKFEVTTRWEDDRRMAFERNGIQGTIAIEPTEIRVQAKLGLLFSPLKGMIEQEIRRKLDEHFS